MKRLYIVLRQLPAVPIMLPLLVAFLCILNLSCDDETTNNDVNAIVFPESNVKYGAHVQPLFDRACAFAGCHGPDTYQFHNGFSLESYQSLMNRIDIVIPGIPENSLLIKSIEGSEGERMPRGLQPLNDNQILGLRRWIAEGAHNN